jgi:hypothetical protein
MKLQSLNDSFGIKDETLPGGCPVAMSRLRGTRTPRNLDKELDKLGWTGAQLAGRAKENARRKARPMCAWTHVSNLLAKARQTHEPVGTEIV